MKKVTNEELLLRIQVLEKEVAAIRARMNRTHEDMWLLKGRILPKQKNPYEIG